MPGLHNELAQLAKELMSECYTIEGHLSKKEISFLALLSAWPSAHGVILEIGSFKGRSTVVLAKASALAAEQRVYAVDPLTSPSVTDPDLRGAVSALNDFEANLVSAGVRERVQFYHMFSQELAHQWSQPLRLLWVDGDHTYAGVKSDILLFKPHLANGAILALHDVLHAFDGPMRVFAEEILASPHFGPCGICGSIGWGQYHSDPASAATFREENSLLRAKVQRLFPFAANGLAPSWFAKLRFKMERSRVPHSSVDPTAWTSRIVRPLR